jgi:glycosyltransferase involved in cell wall biosynthesis
MNCRAGQVVLGLFPELNAIGGIQQVSRHLAWVLQQWAAEQKLQPIWLALNDRPHHNQFALAGQSVPFFGYGRQKAPFSAAALAYGRRACRIVAAHPHLAPVAWLAARWSRTPCWVVAHGFEVWTPLPFYIRRALRAVNGVVAVSQHTATAVIQKQGVQPERVSVLPPALDPAFLASPCERPALPHGCSPVVLTVGRLMTGEPGKGIELVLAALARLQPRYPRLLYVVVGDGDLRPRLEHEVRVRFPALQVWFAGAQPTERLRGFYNAADIFVMPSRQEGFGIVFLEAMASGLPVIAGRCGGAPEVVAEGTTGFLVEPSDPDALAARLAALLDQPELRRRMGEAGRRRVAEHFSFEAFQQRVRHLLDSPATSQETSPL